MDNSSLCRICLQDGATLPLFEKTETGQNIHKKLRHCLQFEKIEDVEGLPRHICEICNTTLDTLYKFVNKFRESCKILEKSLLLVKKEDSGYIDVDADTKHEIEIDLKAIKAEFDDTWDIDDDDGFDNFEDTLPLNVHKKVKLEQEVKKEKPQKSKSHSKRLNKIASSILEGNFSWNGDKWCMKIGQTTLKKVVSGRTEIKKEPKPIKPKPQTKVKLPNTVKEPPSEKLCDLCGNVFPNSERLLCHKKNVHFKNPVQCPKCPRKCSSDYYLKRHIRRKHENKRDFMCALCGLGFAFKGELTSHHKKVHEKILKPKKIYACKLCDKTYACAKSVLIHERSVHTGQRPAECTVCNTSFYHEDYLKEHMRLHTGETPFKCPICGRGYAQRGNMKSHLRIHRISELDAITLSKIKPNYLKLLKL